MEVFWRMDWSARIVGEQLHLFNLCVRVCVNVSQRDIVDI